MTMADQGHQFQSCKLRCKTTYHDTGAAIHQFEALNESRPLPLHLTSARHLSPQHVSTEKKRHIFNDREDISTFVDTHPKHQTPSQSLSGAVGPYASRTPASLRFLV